MCGFPVKPGITKSSSRINGWAVFSLRHTRVDWASMHGGPVSPLRHTWLDRAFMPWREAAVRKDDRLHELRKWAINTRRDEPALG